MVPPGVRIVKPKLLGFLRDGVGGLTNDGENIVVVSRISVRIGRLVVEIEALFAVAVCRVVFTARPFRLRPFLGGGCFCNSKNGVVWSFAVRGRSIPIANVDGGGDSGEEPGDGSVALESSTVDIVVVGDESLEPRVLVESLRV